ncbi:3-deoxy-manno-octulosonate-8-phosphatase KdsC [Corallincola holothuriorum]|uniref:3-deoxy-D-manno-octulosonate 8-phosphate phosphatase KdsC n=1 Tax=Corallincola holothuriorum TaxID=2282215 RepID=A0A368NHY7_9GAMM|nr:3-deoxy-manno-octulosonate-8-phosphatase KdsC [Corallincola holothuriorum]RCU50078.1 3-deoxy-manno-octulosonate-8-phosphatase KdsC [Corallincola holothuriorum]
MTETVQTLYGHVKADILAKAARIRLLICDVDGVFSDGRIYLGNDGEELKAFHTRDGYGIKALQSSDVAVAVITGRQSNIVEQRMTALGVAHIFQGQDNKVQAFSSLLTTTNLTPEQCAYIGDDLVDAPVMQQVGLAISVQDAHPMLHRFSHYKTVIPGGRGAVREVCDLILQAQDKLETSQGLSI